MDCGALREDKVRFKCLNQSCYFCRSCGVVWGRFGATRGPQKPSPERGAAEPGIRKENGEESERLVGGKTAGERSGREWREPERTGRKEREGRGRKQEEAEGKLRKT